MKHRILTLVLALALLLGLVCATGITASAAGSASSVKIGGLAPNADGDFDFPSIVGVSVSGSAHYDSANNELTLTNFQYEGNTAYSIIEVVGDITIKLVGYNSIRNTLNATTPTMLAGINVSGALVIEGDELVVENVGTTLNSNNTAIYANSLEVNCKKLTALAGDFTNGYSRGIQVEDDFKLIGDAKLIAMGYSGAWSSTLNGNNVLPGAGIADSCIVNASSDHSTSSLVTYSEAARDNYVRIYEQL